MYTSARAVCRQLRTAIGKGGPDYKWKQTLLGDQFRREGPIKRRRQQTQYGKKMTSQDGVVQPVQRGSVDASAEGLLTDRGSILRLFGVHQEQELPSRYLVDMTKARNLVARFGSLKEKTVVIVGNGAGLLASCALERGAKHVVGIDIDTTWTEHYERFKKKSNGRFSYRHEDALTMDFEALLEEAGVTRYSWTEDPSVILIVALPPSFIPLFWYQICNQVADRTGVFAFGRVPVAFVANSEFARCLEATPLSTNFSAVSVQRAAYFEVEASTNIPTTGYVGVDRRSNQPDMLVMIEPKERPPPFSAQEIFYASELLVPAKKAVFKMTLVTLLTHATTQGVARKILDSAALDGGISLHHLSEPEVLGLVFQLIERVPNTSQSAPVATAPITFDRLPGWDPLLDTFIENQEHAAQW